MNSRQLIIVGAGPAGLACSIAASRAGLDHVVLEKGTVVNSIYHFPTDMTFFSTPEKLAIGGLPFTCPDQKPSRRQAVAYYRAVAEHYALPVRTGRTVCAVRRRGSANLPIGSALLLAILSVSRVALHHRSELPVNEGEWGTRSKASRSKHPDDVEDGRPAAR